MLFRFYAMGGSCFLLSVGLRLLQWAYCNGRFGAVGLFFLWLGVYTVCWASYNCIGFIPFWLGVCTVYWASYNCIGFFLFIAGRVYGVLGVLCL
jgi:hypothetical protein